MCRHPLVISYCNICLIICILYPQGHNTETKLSDISTALSETCNCYLSVHRRVFSCPDMADSETVVFLAELNYTSLPEVDVPSLLTSWVASGPAITVISVQLQVDVTCPVVIDSLKAESCPELPTDPPTDVIVIAASIGGAVLVVVVIIIAVTMAAVLCRKQSKYRYVSYNVSTNTTLVSLLYTVLIVST